MGNNNTKKFEYNDFLRTIETIESLWSRFPTKFTSIVLMYDTTTQK